MLPQWASVKCLSHWKHHSSVICKTLISGKKGCRHRQTAWKSPRFSEPRAPPPWAARPSLPRSPVTLHPTPPCLPELPASPVPQGRHPGLVQAQSRVCREGHVDHPPGPGECGLRTWPGGRGPSGLAVFLLLLGFGLTWCLLPQLEKEAGKALWFLEQSVSLFKSPQAPIRQAAVWFAGPASLRATVPLSCPQPEGGSDLPGRAGVRGVGAALWGKPAGRPHPAPRKSIFREEGAPLPQPSLLKTLQKAGNVIWT